MVPTLELWLRCLSIFLAIRFLIEGTHKSPAYPAVEKHKLVSYKYALDHFIAVICWSSRGC